MGQRTSVYLDDDLHTAAKASGIPLAELVRRGLAAEAEPQAAAAPPAGRPITLPAGDPCPGTACAGPGCWQRDTARYGLRRLVLCTACAHALTGQTYQRDLPPGAARLIRRGAA